MGQKSIPVLNKVGISMFWNSMWDDKINYSKNLHKFLTTSEITYNIINNLTTLNVFRKNFVFFKKNYKNTKYKIFLLNNIFIQKIIIKYIFLKYDL